MNNIFFTFLALLAYFLAPDKYNIFFIQTVTMLFLLQAIIFIVIKSKDNYINFYTIFYFSYYFTNFFYASILYPIDPEIFPIFTLNFNHDVINRSTALAWVVSSFIILGANKNIFKCHKDKNNNFYSHKETSIITGSLVFLFILSVGRKFLSGDFTAQSSSSLYILQLVVCFFVISSVAFFRSYFSQNLKILYFTISFIYILLFLSIGDRGPALSLLILMIAMYSHHVKKIKIIVSMPILIFGAFLMYLIGVGRITNSSNGENIILRGLNGFNMSFEDFYYITSDLSGSSFALYLGQDYVTKNGINYGITLISDIIAVFPFFQSMLKNALDFELLTSPAFFTELALGKNAAWGVGTNLVSDIYISFGLAGCIILFYLFGILIERLRIKLINSNSFELNIIYFTLVSYALYLPRAGFFMPLKFIIWSLIIYYILRSLSIIKPREVK